MAGIADIWEGPIEGGAYPIEDGASTILAIKVFNDKIFIAQGGGLTTFLKVLSPNGIEIYNLGANMSLMTHTAQDVYGSMAVISDYEIVLGYMYINLKMLFIAPYGIDLSGFWRNPAVKVVPTRVSSSSWTISLRDGVNWRTYLVSKESPENCLPCKTKVKIASDLASFECREENYSRHALNISGYKADRNMMESGVSLSVSRMGGLGAMKPISRPKVDNKKCNEAIEEYSRIFNKSKISPSDVGVIGQKMSNSCSKVMFLSMLQIVEYKEESIRVHNDYIKDILGNNGDQSGLIDDCKNIVQLIYPMLSELKKTSSDSDFLKDIFKRQEWWGPIWIIGNGSKVTALNKSQSAYTLIGKVRYEEFLQTILDATNNEDDTSTTPLPMGWVIMADKNQTPIKYGKESVTYFRFPFAICTSTRPLFTVGNHDFNSVCEIETRADGVLVWVWDDRSTLWNKQWMRLRCYKISNDGVLTTLDEIDIGYDMSPVDDSAKSVGVAEDSSYWIVRDYFIKDSVNGGIGYVESKVNISTEMQEIYGASASMYYSNCNEMSGAEGSSSSTMKYRDGTLEHDWSLFDLDDNRMRSLAWGNDGTQYSFVSGYTGYQIAVAGEL